MSELIRAAIGIASQAHAGQKRKHTGRPYICHPLQVGATLMRFGEPDYVVAAGICHDVLEDSVYPSTFSEHIRHDLGEQVRYLVHELTNPSHRSEHRDKPRAERKRIDREHLAAASPDARKIKLVDRTDNIWSLVGEAPGSEFLRLYVDETHLLLLELPFVHTGMEAELGDALEAARKTFVTQL